MFSQPNLLESYLNEALSSIHECVVNCGRRETPLLVPSGDTTAILHRHIQQILLAFVAVLQDLALNHSDEVSKGIRKCLNSLCSR